MTSEALYAGACLRRSNICRDRYHLGSPMQKTVRFSPVQATSMVLEGKGMPKYRSTEKRDTVHIG